MTIGERVKELRIKKDLTQLELAELLGYKSKSSVAHIENGREIPRSMVVKLAEVLDTTPSYLMGWDTDSSGEAPTEDKKDPPSADSERWERFRAKYDQLPAVEQHRIDAVLDAMLSDPADDQDQ